MVIWITPFQFHIYPPYTNTTTFDFPKSYYSIYIHIYLHTLYRTKGKTSMRVDLGGKAIKRVRTRRYFLLCYSKTYVRNIIGTE